MTSWRSSPTGGSWRTRHPTPCGTWRSGARCSRSRPSGPFDGADLEAVAPIDHVRQTGLRSLLVTTKDAATTTPVVMDAVERAGGSVVSITEHRSSFDEVFAELIRKAGAAARRRDRMRGLLTAMLRILAVLGKELLETFRRPTAVASIVFGPFVILIVFGLGYLGQPSIRAALVIPDGSGLPTDLATYQDHAEGGLTIVAIDAAEETARDRLRAKDVDVIVVAPDDASGDAATRRAGRAASRIRQHRPVHRPAGRQRRRPDLERGQSRAHPTGGRGGAEGGERRRFAAARHATTRTSWRRRPGRRSRTSRRRHPRSPGSTGSPCSR